MGGSAADWLRVGRAERAARCDLGHLSAEAAPFNRTPHPASLTLERLRKSEEAAPRSPPPPAPRAGLSGHPEP